MKKLVRKDIKKRKSFFNSEKKKIIFKTIIKNYGFCKTEKKKISSNLLKNFKHDTLTQTVNRCILTGRKKRLNKMFNFSRVYFRKLIRSGFIFGFKKSSW